MRKWKRMRTSRRAVLAAGAAAAGGVLTTGCAKYGDEGGGGAPPPESPKPPGSDPAGEQPSDEATPGGGKELARTSEILVGGGRVFGAEKVVVTQPAAGTFKAFSAVCTHQGCLVKTVEGGTINCPCHGSKFRVADASVAGGPAPKPLAARRIAVESDSIRLV
ncbi:Rieske (2Fe-2S) protein [Streptomyces sp. 21So2-11]|uniref:Rieske (2Fe-2S) protein n=1 Tax=Streptomyces sp. 21So2-11 TaxID=3144408 RepID=UPI0032192B40